MKKATRARQNKSIQLTTSDLAAVTGGEIEFEPERVKWSKGGGQVITKP